MEAGEEGWIYDPESDGLRPAEEVLRRMRRDEAGERVVCMTRDELLSVLTSIKFKIHPLSREIEVIVPSEEEKE